MVSVVMLEIALYDDGFHVCYYYSGPVAFALPAPDLLLASFRRCSYHHLLVV